jgi:hypothetical protein
MPAVVSALCLAGLLIAPIACRAQLARSAAVDGYYEFYAGHTLEQPAEFITGRNRLRLDGSYRFGGGRAVASLRLTQSFVDPQDGGSFTGLKARLWEAYVDFQFARIDIRLGQQLIVWGQADGAFITDMLSPLDVSEFLAQDFADIRLPIPAIKVDFFAEHFSVTGALTVIPTETVIPSESSPWFIVPELPAVVEVGLAESNLPGIALEHVEPALRLSYSGLDRTEIRLMYAYAFNRLPGVGARFAGVSEGVARFEIVPTYYRRHVAGLRWSTSVTDPWVMDSEVAYERRFDVEMDPFGPGFASVIDGSSNGLLSVNHVQGMLGLERVIGSNFARIQVLGSLIWPDDDRITREPLGSSLTGLFRRSFRRETIFASLFAFYNIGKDAWLNPSVQWSPGWGFNLYAGLQVFLAGNRSGGLSSAPFALYSENDFAYIRVTQHF